MPFDPTSATIDFDPSSAGRGEFDPDSAQPISESAKGDLGEAFKATGKEFAAAFDTVASIPGFLLKLGATGIGDMIYSMKALYDGGGDPAVEADRIVKYAANTDAGKLLSSPVSTILDDLGIKNVTKGTLSEEVMGKISSGIQHVQANTEDPNKQALIGQVANVLMASLGEGAAKVLGKVEGVPKATPAESKLVMDNLVDQAAKETSQEPATPTEEPAPQEAQQAPQEQPQPEQQQAPSPETTSAPTQDVVPQEAAKAEQTPITEQAPAEQTATKESLQQDVQQKLQDSGTIPQEQVTPEQMQKAFEQQSEVTNNASGESPASQESINRLQQQNSAGTKMYEVNIETGEATPLNTVDRVDKNPAAGNAIIQVAADGTKTIVDNNSKYGNTPALNRIDYLSKDLPKADKISPLGGVGKKQGGAVGLKPEEPTLQDKAKTMSEEEWTKEFNKEYPQHADNPAVAARVYSKLKPLDTPAKEVNNIRELTNQKIKDWEGQGNVNSRIVMQGKDAIEKMVPKEADRNALYDVIDQGKDNENPTVKLFRGLSDAIWQKANDAGILKSYVQDYITHMYDFGRQGKTEAMTALYRLADKLDENRGTSGMSTKSPYTRERTFKTLQDAANQLGLKPLTKDISKVYQAYATSMLRAVTNKNLIEELGKVQTKDGYKALINRPQDGNIPAGYTMVNHPQFINKLVDKNIAPTLQSMFDTYNPHMITRVAHSVSILAKTAIFSYSMFHNMSMGLGYLGTVRGRASLANGYKLYKDFKSGPSGDLVEKLLRGGFKTETPIDLNPTVMEALVSSTAKIMDKVVPGLGYGVKVPYAATKALQHLTFGIIQPILKFSIAGQEYARLVGKGVPETRAAELASTFANDMQGGVNWRRIALNADTKLGGDLANFLASRQGQYHAQIWALAPDWTVATARSWLGAIRKGTDPHEKLMYAKYLTQSAIITLLAQDYLNMHFSGHHFWQNQDPTQVDMGDGRKMQINKHFYEGIHWIRDFDQTALNKMGTVPSEFFAQALNKQYLSNKGAPDIVPKQTKIQALLNPKSEIEQKLEATAARAKHLGTRFLPITSQNILSGTPEEALSGFAGVPIRGTTKEEQVKEKMQRLMGM